MDQTFSRLKKLVGASTDERRQIIEGTMKGLGLEPITYKIESPRGIDSHVSVSIDRGADLELWLSANYDTVDNIPAANNNASGVVTLMDLTDAMLAETCPVNVRMWYFDAGFDPNLFRDKKRSNDYIPGSQILLQYMIDHEIEFLDNFVGIVTLQGVGKGNLTVFRNSARYHQNSSELNKAIRELATPGTKVEILDNSPPADHVPFLKEELKATVVTRYDVQAGKRMYTSADGISNVNVRLMDQNVQVMLRFLKTFGAEKYGLR